MKFIKFALIVLLIFVGSSYCAIFQSSNEETLKVFELLGEKARRDEDAFPDIESILNDCKENFEKTAIEKADVAVTLLKLLSVLHGRDKYVGSNAFISEETPKAHEFWTIYAGIMVKAVDKLNEIEMAMEANTLKSILTLTDFYNIIDQLNAPVRVAIDPDLDTGDVFEPYELVMPVLLVVLKGAEPFRMYNETLFYGSEPSLSFIIDTANAITAFASFDNLNEIDFQYAPKFKLDDFQNLFEQEITKETKLKWHKRNFIFYLQNQNNIGDRAFAGNRKEIPIVAAFCSLHQISAEGFDLKETMLIDEILDLFAMIEFEDTNMSKLVQYFSDWLKKEISIDNEMITTHAQLYKQARELSYSQIEEIPIEEFLQKKELLKTRFRYFTGSFEQTRGPFAHLFYELIKHIVETDKWLEFEGFFDELNRMDAIIYVIPSKGQGYRSRLNEIDRLLKTTLLKLDELLKTPERKEIEMNLLLSMILYNAAEEITDYIPYDIPKSIKKSGITIFKVIADFVHGGELEAFDKNSLFRAALREFIRNLSRMADDLLPTINEVTNIARNLQVFDLPKEKNRAYFIFFLKLAYGFSLTFNDEKLPNNMIEIMFELEPSDYEQGDISLVFEKNNFLSSRGLRVGEIIGENLHSESLIRNIRDLLRCYMHLEFAKQFTPESNQFNVMFTTKMQFKRGILEAAHSIIATTRDLQTIKDHPELTVKLDRLTNSFLHENNFDVPKKLDFLIRESYAARHPF